MKRTQDYFSRILQKASVETLKELKTKKIVKIIIKKLTKLIKSQKNHNSK